MRDIYFNAGQARVQNISTIAEAGQVKALAVYV